MMYCISLETGKPLSFSQIEHCLKRNFGGKADVAVTIKQFKLGINQSSLEAGNTESDAKV